MVKDNWLFIFAAVQALGSVFSVLVFFGITWSSTKTNLGSAVTNQAHVISMILMIVLLTGSFLASGIGWYRVRHRQSFTVTPTDQQEIVYGKSFANERVELDGKRFQKCTFENVTLVYHGTTNFSFESNVFKGSLSMDTDSGAVAAMLMLLKAAGWIRQDIPFSTSAQPNSPIPINPN
jgi:hypothetical protein